MTQGLAGYVNPNTRSIGPGLGGLSANANPPPPGAPKQPTVAAPTVTPAAPAVAGPAPQGGLGGSAVNPTVNTHNNNTGPGVIFGSLFGGGDNGSNNPGGVPTPSGAGANYNYNPANPLAPPPTAGGSNTTSGVGGALPPGYSSTVINGTTY